MTNWIYSKKTRINESLHESFLTELNIFQTWWSSVGSNKPP